MIDPGSDGLPPRAPARVMRLEHGGDTRDDPWYWLRERDDPSVLAYLEAENSYTAATLAHLAPLRDALYAEIVARVQETDATAPARHGPFEYFSRTIEGQQYDVQCRRPAGTRGLPDPAAAPGSTPGEEVVLDENDLAIGHDFLEVGDLAVSPGHDVAAYTVDTDGGERFELRFRDLAGGRPLDDVVEDVYYGLAFANDGRTVLYVRPDDAMRPFQVWRHVLGTPADDDVLLYQEDDERYFVSVERARSGRVLVITSASKVTTEVRLLDADRPDGAPLVVEPRLEGHEYHVEHHHGPAGERLFVLSNAVGENFGLYATPRATPGREHWSLVLTARDDARLEDVDAFDGRIVVSERADAHEQLRVLDLGPDGDVVDDHVVAPPDAVGSMWLGANRDWAPSALRYGYTSLVVPPSAYDYDPDTRTATLVKQQPVPGYDPSRYETERVWASAPDGTSVPISMVWRRDRPRDVPGPTLLYGYGAYEVSIDPTFSASRVSLLDRGVAYAIAHVRGGGELGRRWYEEGKLLAKPNTFTDFVACARHLVAVGVASPEQLVARGGSAGGLLMGAVANLAPEQFRAIVAEVPFVDCLTTMLDESLPLTVTEWDEWGDPATDPAVYEAMRSYSPYDNVEAKDYPALLVTAGLNDPRVQYWEPAKWVAKLRATKTDAHPLLLKTELGAGHHGPSGRYDTWRQEAFVLAFVLDQVGAGRVSDIVPTTCTTGDGLTLEAELVVAEGTARAAAVLCHPHPQFGGTMRSIVIGALFDALPPAGVTCLRFNFRGVEGSDGFHDGGRGEQLDVVAAIEALDAQVDPALPMLLAGWSFGADLALATVVDRVAGWFAIAPPLRSAPDFSAVAGDPRSKLLALAEHDEIRPPASVADQTEAWAATAIEVVGGASHYFVGRTDRLVALALAFVDRLTAPI